MSAHRSAAEKRPNLYGLDRQQLREWFDGHGAATFHAEQVFAWLYARRSLHPDAWTDLARDLRGTIARQADVDAGRIASRTSAGDGTVKYLVDLPGGGSVEAVYLLQNDRVTLCISSQVGCALACDFCLTGRMGLVRNLSPGEIVGQVALIHDDRELSGVPFRIVFMGMGEPLHNYAAVSSALRLLTDSKGFGISRQRITLSTAGWVPAIEQLAADGLRPRLAVSLNATTDEVRDRLMPVNRKFPLARLLPAVREFARTSGSRPTLEYVMLAGVNDRDADIPRLARIVREVPAKLNLIPFNPVPGWLDYTPPKPARIEAFRDRLLGFGIPVSIRWSRGAEARAACGQLALLPAQPPPGA